MDRRQLLGSGLAAGALAAVGPVAAARAPVIRQMVVEAVQMPAWTVRDGRRLPLTPGDAVTTDRVVETAARAALVLLLPEGSRISLGEKTQLAVERLGAGAEDGRIGVRADLRVLEGFFRFATSAVSRVVGRREINVGLRTATAGIRGTDFWCMTDTQHDAACLFEGRIALATRDQGGVTLDKPGAFWARFFERPVQPVGVATPDQLAGFITSTALLPGQGVAVQGGAWRVQLLSPTGSRAALGLAGRLREAGYPAQLQTVGGRYEVLIHQLATREDAQAVLERLRADTGADGRVLAAG